MAVIDRVLGPAGTLRDVRPPERVGKNLMATPGGALYQLEGSASAWPTGWPDAFGPTPDEAMTYSPWYRAVWILSSTMAMTPCHVYKQTKAKTGYDKSPDEGHRFYNAVHHQANTEETAFQARLRMTSFAVVHGNAIAVIYEPKGEPPELIPVMPNQWTMHRRKGEIWYFIDVYGPDERNISKRYRKLRPESVFHLKHWSPDGLMGYATYWYARYALAEGTVGAKVRMARGRNAGRPALALTTEQALPPGHAMRIQNDFVNIHEGFDGSAKPAVLDRGLKPVVLPYSADQKHETVLAELPVQDVANFTGVPASWLGNETTEANAETDELKFQRYGIGFWYEAYEDEGKAKLLTGPERFGQTHTVKFDRLTREWQDAKSRTEMIRTYLAGQPVGSVNEVRQKIGWDPRDEPEADELQQPLNMGQGGDKNQPEDVSKPGPGRPKKKAAASTERSISPQAVRALVMHQAARMTRWITKDARRHAGNPDAFITFIDSIEAEFRPRFDVEWEMLEPFGTKRVDMIARLVAEFNEIAGTTHARDLKQIVDDFCTVFETSYPVEVANQAAS